MADILLKVGIDPKIDYTPLEQGINAMVEKINSNPRKIKVAFDIDKTSLDTLRSQIDQLYKSMSNVPATKLSSSGRTTTAQSLRNEASAAKQAEQALKSKSSTDKQAIADARAKESAIRKYYNVLTQVEAAIKNYSAAENSSNKGSKEAYTNLLTQRDALRRLNGEVSSGQAKTDSLQAATSKASMKLKENTAVIKANGDATRTWGERIANLSTKFSTWFSITQVMMYAIRSIRQMISASIELDSAMAQMQIVTKATESQMNQFADSAANAAKRIGSSITDFMSSATTFARLGYSMDESSQLAEFTAMLQNVGDIDVSEAQDAITSIVKAFDVDTDKIESVMDKLVATGNAFPISVSQIAQGMTNASSALAAAGNSFEQSIALLTAANTTINLCRAA